MFTFEAEFNIFYAYDCSLCFLDICTENNNKCIKMVTTNEVLEAIAGLLPKVIIEEEMIYEN